MVCCDVSAIMGHQPLPELQIPLANACLVGTPVQGLQYRMLYMHSELNGTIPRSLL